eukprot:CFRG4830T1
MIGFPSTRTKCPKGVEVIMPCGIESTSPVELSPTGSPMRLPISRSMETIPQQQQQSGGGNQQTQLLTQRESANLFNRVLNHDHNYYGYAVVHFTPEMLDQAEKAIKKELSDENNDNDLTQKLPPVA